MVTPKLRQLAVSPWRHVKHFPHGAATHAIAMSPTASGLPTGTLEGVNDWKRTGYGGPCPPIGRHRYFHKLYALDRELPDLHRPTKPALEAAMLGHVLGQAELMGTYQKKGRAK